METVYIALGTNLGDRLANLRAALACLAPQVRVIRESPVYETPPWGYEDQPAFLNMVVEAETDLSPRALLDYLKRTEDDLGRAASFRYGPRKIDLDILFYAQFILNETDLQIPHPRLHERAFVLVPLDDLIPGFRHPILKKTVRAMLADVDVRAITPFSV